MQTIENDVSGPDVPINHNSDVYKLKMNLELTSGERAENILKVYMIFKRH